MIIMLAFRYPEATGSASLLLPCSFGHHRPARFRAYPFSSIDFENNAHYRTQPRWLLPNAMVLPAAKTKYQQHKAFSQYGKCAQRSNRPKLFHIATLVQLGCTCSALIQPALLQHEAGQSSAIKLLPGKVCSALSILGCNYSYTEHRAGHQHVAAAEKLSPSDSLLPTNAFKHCKERTAQWLLPTWSRLT
jgi:hypothetical protein